MLQIEEDRRAVYQFNDLPEMVDYCLKTPRRWRAEVSRTCPRELSWDLNTNWEQALALARDGWADGVRNLHVLAATIPNSIRMTKEYNVCGDYPDVSRFLAGDPYNMVKRGKVRVPKPAMTIVCNIGANYNVTAQQMANFGAAMVALTDRLESRGVRVELLGCWRTAMDKGHFAMSWHIKRAEDAIDLSAVAFGLGHPAMLRRLSFGVVERSPRYLEQSNYGVSQPVIGKKHIVEDLPGALFIGGVGSAGEECSTVPKALAFAKAAIDVAYRAAGYGDSCAELEDEDGPGAF